MSTETPKRSTPFAFTTHDGLDENNQRAEVFVQVNKGIIKEIKENTTAEVADVHFGVNGLKFPIHGWIRMDEPVFELVKAAHASGEEVDFRIETQRKASVKRDIPMEVLRVDSATARENVKVILVGINGVLSGEAVTNPKQDPKSVGGRYVAGDEDVIPQASSANSASAEDLLTRLKEASTNPSVRSSILDSLAAFALASGVSAEDVNEALTGKDKRDASRPEARQSFALEAPSWKEYNSDGRLNLGSGVVAAGVGIETLVHDRITLLAEDENIKTSEIVNFDEAVDYYTRLVFAIADRIQVASYGQGARVDRAAASHVRIRGIVYEIIKKSFPLPIRFADIDGLKTINISETENTAWLVSVGKEGIARFARAIKAATTIEGFSTIQLSATLKGESKPSEQAVAPVTPEEPVTAASTPTKAAEAPASAPTVTPEQPQEEEIPTNVHVEEESVVETENLPESTDIVAETAQAGIPATLSSLGVLEPRHLTPEEVDGEDLADEELIGRFKELFAESGFNIQDKGDQIRIARLLGYTFGENYTNVKKLPEFVVEEFIDWYEANGAEALHAAVALATERA